MNHTASVLSKDRMQIPDLTQLTSDLIDALALYKCATCMWLIPAVLNVKGVCGRRLPAASACCSVACAMHRIVGRGTSTGG